MVYKSKKKVGGNLPNNSYRRLSLKKKIAVNPDIMALINKKKVINSSDINIDYGHFIKSNEPANPFYDTKLNSKVGNLKYNLNRNLLMDRIDEMISSKSLKSLTNAVISEIISQVDIENPLKPVNKEADEKVKDIQEELLNYMCEFD
jgi:hypothetical protein